MKEILGNELKEFFVKLVNVNKSYKEGLKQTYKGKDYEVWEVSDELFDVICNLTEDDFERLAGFDAWWRYAEGSVLDYPNSKVYIKGHELIGWSGESWEDDDEDDEFEIYSSDLTTYIHDVFDISQPRNVCAIAVDLAKYNNMTLGELFAKCQG